MKDFFTADLKIPYIYIIIIFLINSYLSTCTYICSISLTQKLNWKLTVHISKYLFKKRMKFHKHVAFSYQ